MFALSHSLQRTLCSFGLIIMAGIILVSCGPSSTNTAVQTSPYDRAKDAFKSGQLDKALDLTEKLATGTPPEDSTDRARMLRAVIYAGQLKGNKELAEAYNQGAEKAASAQTRSAYHRLRHDILVTAGKAAMGLAATARQIAPDGVIAKELTLDASYPTTEGPSEVKELAAVEKGTSIESEQQESASADALRKGVDDALANVVAGDRAKAREALAGGPLKLEGAAFAIFLAQELAEGGAVFDKHHSLDPQKLRLMCDEGDDTLKAALALLKDTPNKDQEKEVKKLQDKFKALRKSVA
jgi:hypothetical protein